MPKREGPVTEAGFSVVAFETWLKEARPDDPRRDRGLQPRRLRLDVAASGLARGAAGGGRCPVAGVRLGTSGRRRTARPATAASPSGSGLSRSASPRLTANRRRSDPQPDRAATTRLLADLLDWHRREEKSQWWRWFELKDDLTIEELVEERDALAGLAFVDEVTLPSGMIQRRYRFEPQDHNFDPGDDADRQGDRQGSLARSSTIDDAEGMVELEALAERGVAAPDRAHPSRAARCERAQARDAARRRCGYRRRDRRRRSVPGDSRCPAATAPDRRRRPRWRGAPATWRGCPGCCHPASCARTRRRRPARSRGRRGRARPTPALG